MGYRIRVRYMQMLLLFLCTTFAGFCILALNINILAMTDKSLHNSTIQTFDWDLKIQGILLSSFLWGNIPIQFPASLLISIFGTKNLVTASHLLMGFLSVITPWTARSTGWMGVCFLRFVQGIAQGSTFPSIHTILGHWAPICERNRLGCFVYSGLHVASALAMPVSGVIASSYLCWPWVFYLVGGLCIMCGLLWATFGAESPAKYKRISEEERKFIENSINQSELNQKKLKTPWKSIFTNPAVLSLIATQMGTLWGCALMIMETPGFIKNALHVDLQNSGFLTALPYGISCLIIFTTSTLSDFLLNRQCLSLTGIRKLMNTIGTCGPAIGLILITFLPPGNIPASITLLVIIVSLDTVSSMGYMLNHIDLSPNFAGILVSIGNTASNSFALLAPIATGYLITDAGDVSQWRIIFYMTAAFYFIGNTLFLIYGSGEVQSFNDNSRRKSKDVSTEVTESLVQKSEAEKGKKKMDLLDI